MNVFQAHYESDASLSHDDYDYDVLAAEWKRVITARRSA